MKVQILHVLDCPHTAVLAGRLEVTLIGRPDVLLEHHVVLNQAEAALRGMTGSPTLLIDGVDPFAVPGQQPSLSCRLYIDEQGAKVGAPSVEQLQAALRGVQP